MADIHGGEIAEAHLQREPKTEADAPASRSDHGPRTEGERHCPEEMSLINHSFGDGPRVQSSDLRRAIQDPTGAKSAQAGWSPTREDRKL